MISDENSLDDEARLAFEQFTGEPAKLWRLKLRCAGETVIRWTADRQYVERYLRGVDMVQVVSVTCYEKRVG